MLNVRQKLSLWVQTLKSLYWSNPDMDGVGTNHSELRVNVRYEWNLVWWKEEVDYFWQCLALSALLSSASVSVCWTFPCQCLVLVFRKRHSVSRVSFQCQVNHEESGVNQPCFDVEDVSQCVGWAACFYEGFEGGLTRANTKDSLLNEVGVRLELEKSGKLSSL